MAAAGPAEAAGQAAPGPFAGGSPRAAGFAMPAEWAPHARTWMAWPCREDFWPDLEAARRAFAEVARAIADFEPVTMIAPLALAAEAGSACGPAVAVEAIEIDDSWTRDSGPSFVRHPDGRLGGVSWRFNAWGGKHAPWERDARLAETLLSRLGLPCHEGPLTLEGGALHVDGEGTLLTTESVVFNANRNPGLERAEAERLLCESLGVERVVWLPGDVEEIETDGHVDGIACFAAPGRVLIGSVDPAVPHAAALRENRRALELARDARGRAFEIVELPEADPAVATNEIYCTAYINFYLVNGGLVMPAYGLPSDAAAAEVLGRAFPGRRVVAVDVRAIAPGGGGIHCITQQQPL